MTLTHTAYFEEAETGSGSVHGSFIFLQKNAPRVACREICFPTGTIANVVLRKSLESRIFQRHQFFSFANRGPSRYSGRRREFGHSEYRILSLTLVTESRIQLDEILPLVYSDLRDFASQQLRGERQGHTLQTTALVHEAYVRMARLREINWRNQDDVLRAAIGVMRRVLIDWARSRKARKRDAGKMSLNCPIDNVADQSSPTFDLLALDEALERLREIDSAKAEVVELRYFGGQTIEETARILDLSPATVKRHWSFAKAWLFRELNEDDVGQP